MGNSINSASSGGTDSNFVFDADAEIDPSVSNAVASEIVSAGGQTTEKSQEDSAIDDSETLSEDVESESVLPSSEQKSTGKTKSTSGSSSSSKTGSEGASTTSGTSAQSSSLSGGKESSAVSSSGLLATSLLGDGESLSVSPSVATSTTSGTSMQSRTLSSSASGSSPASSSGLLANYLLGTGENLGGLADGLLTTPLLNVGSNSNGVGFQQIVGADLLSSASIGTLSETITALRATTNSPGGISSTSSAFNLGSGTIARLFELGAGLGGDSIKDLMEKYPYLPFFVIYAIAIARGDEVTTEMFAESILSQQQRQRSTTYSMIEESLAIQSKNEKLANDDWLRRVGTDCTGLDRKEDPPSKCEKVVRVIAAIIVFVVLGPLVAFLLSTIVVAIINATMDDSAAKRRALRIAGYFSPAEVWATVIVAIVCELGGYSENDEKIQKLKMGLKIAFDILMAIILVVISVVITVFTGGTAAAMVFMAVMTIISVIQGVLSIINGVKQMENADKALKRAEQKLIINRLVAFLEKIKLDLQSLSQEMEMLIELFSNSFSDVRTEYDKASRILKDYNETKQAIARNLKA